LRICIPVYRGGRRHPWLIRLGMIAYDLLSFRKTLPRHEILSAASIGKAEPGLATEGLRVAARYYDAQVTFAERLVLENLLAARSAGAIIRTHSEVTRIDVEDGAVAAVTCRDAAGNELSVPVKVIVNAAGPWVDRVLDVAPVRTRRLMGGTKGSHIIVGSFEGASGDALYVEAETDGRPFFIIPWNGQCLVGTTDIRYDGNLDDVRVSDGEVDYLLAETNRVFPRAGLTRADIHYAYAGVRPLPHKKKGPESAITRRHIIRENSDIARGLLSIIGGKLTTYRSLAEQTVDTIARLLNRRLPDCRTRDTELPGAWGTAKARDALTALGCLSDAGVERMLGIYGGRAAAIAAQCADQPALARTLDGAGRVLAAEVVFAIREEFAQSLEDIVFRRLMVGLDSDQGRGLYEDIAEIAAAEAGWGPETIKQQLEELSDFAESLRVE
jgi:glycerol-3-phosphate dehydrogenase